jgi:diguanylate cyclase (GGDEF)-like protein/PAS domain S-box-containing protein
MPAASPPSRRAAVRAWLPRGQSLPEADWLRRHRAMLAILWAHVLVLPVFGIANGVPPALAIGTVIPIALAGIAGSLRRAGRRARSVAVVFGLLTASAVLVNDWHGAIEAHFSFFVMIAVIALYEDWVPFGVAVGYVVAEHGILSPLFPHSVYAHGGNPWLWTAVHGGFVLAMSIAGVVSWRLNEDMRVRMDDAMSEARTSAESLRLAFDGSVAGMAFVAPDGSYLRVNAALCAMTGYSEAELLGRTAQSITYVDDQSADRAPLAALNDGSLDHYATEKRYVHRDGHDIWADVAVNAIHDDHGELAYMITQAYDITERRRYEGELAHRALHDPLTGLPNRTLFTDRSDHAIARARRHGGVVSVLYIDLDRFKLVNDSLGHNVGDGVLRETARRLTAASRGEDTVARLGGDEFTVLCEDTDAVAARTVAERILAAFAAPFVVAGHEFTLTASVGVRTADGSAHNTTILLRDADVALYRAKERGRSRLEIFDEVSAPGAAADLLATEQALRLALEHGDLCLHYQPTVDLTDGHTTAVEALVRWEHPERGLVPPGEFIPVAEESELIVEIGEWVLEEACGQLTRWLSAGQVTAGLRMAVNISARQVSRPELPETVAEILARTGLAPGRLCLEMTESSLIREPDIAIANLVALKALGVSIAIDDFGVGFSSLDQIRALPALDVIKIDRSFTAGLGASRADEAIIAAVLSLTKSLNAVCVVEGIEDRGQLALLREMGGDIGQGFYFSRPLPADLVLPLLATGVRLPLEATVDLSAAA